MVDTLHTRLDRLYSEHGGDDVGLTREGYQALLRGLITLLQDADREGALVNAIITYRAQLPTGPAGGQVRAALAKMLQDVYGPDDSLPKGVFDD